MAIIAVLVALLIPTVSSLVETARATKCVSNLRSIAGAIRLSAADNNNKWLIMTSANMTWSNRLRDGNYLASDNATLCPSLLVKPYDTYQTYGLTWLGVALPPDDLNVINASPAASEGPRTSYEINFTRINRPSQYLLMADSYTTRFKSQYHIVQGAGAMDEIHLRHKNRANVLFADCHVGALDTKELRDIGWNRAFTKDGIFTTF